MGFLTLVLCENQLIRPGWIRPGVGGMGGVGERTLKRGRPTFL